MKFVKPSRISGRIEAPPSKSMMQRAVIASALAEGVSVITNPSFCDDALAAMKVVKAMGADVGMDGKEVTVEGGMEPEGGRLDCGESGTCMRMISAVAALYPKEFEITGRGSLMGRPVSMIEEPLRSLGAECSTDGGKPPIRLRGPIEGGDVRVDGSESSQFLSGLLMALPLCRKDSAVEAAGLRSGPYVRMTQVLMKDFGVRIESDRGMERFAVKGNQKYTPRMYEVEGDWSGAAFMLVAGAIAGEITVGKLSLGSQPDQAVKSVLIQAGAAVGGEGSEVKASRSHLAAFEYDAADSPDLFPPLAVLACFCKGTSVINGASRLRSKESDRAAALASELGRLGAEIKVEGDSMEIRGGKLRGGRMDSRNDHRIAMAGAVAALASEAGVEIEGEGCVSKSYPGFFDELERLMVR
jgi:3-phosphoshikimate 1-carboxyvinyltransferase